MYVHEEIILAMTKIQKKHDMTKTEVIAQMAQAIHVMLEFIEPSLKAISEHFEKERA